MDKQKEKQIKRLFEGLLADALPDEQLETEVMKTYNLYQLIGEVGRLFTEKLLQSQLVMLDNEWQDIKPEEWQDPDLTAS